MKKEELYIKIKKEGRRIDKIKGNLLFFSEEYIYNDIKFKFYFKNKNNYKNRDITLLNYEINL